MTDLQATLDAIDQVAVHECGHCSKPLREDGPSADFCNEVCQTAWLGNKRRVEQLIGYREPIDLMYDQPPSRPGGYTTPGDIRADLLAMRDTISRQRYAPDPFARRSTAQRDPHTEDGRAAIGRVQAGEWLALLAAPWHPSPLTVRPSFGGRPPEMLNAIRPGRLTARWWTADDESVEFDTPFTQDVYRLESVNEHDRSAIYRIQGLPGPRRAIFIASDWQVPDWWMRDGWEGRCVEVEGNASGFRWAHPNGDRLIAEPTERYENLPDGVVAEVWGPRPDPAESAEEFRAEMNRRRSLQEAMLRAPAPLDLQAFRRITGGVAVMPVVAGRAHTDAVVVDAPRQLGRTR